MKQENRYPLDNPAKSSPYDRKKSPERILKEKEEKKARKKKRIGLLIALLQGILTIIVFGMLFTIDLLPFKYMAIVVAVLGGLLVFAWKTQGHKGIHIAGKVLGLIMIPILAVMIYVLFLTNQSFQTIASNSEKGKNKVISETVFSVSINDKGEEKIWLVNTDYYQILEICVPNNYYMAIPGVSEGKKDILINAEEHGEEAVRLALGALYETKIPYRVKLDSDEIKDMAGKELLSLLLQPKKFISNWDQNIDTNLSKGQIRQLVKLYLGDNEVWYLYEMDAKGQEVMQTTYTNPKEKTAVVEPDQKSVEKIIDMINRVEDGEKIKEKHMKTQ